MQISQKITPFLWFDSQAEEAARFYVGIFKNSKIGRVTRYSEAGREIHGRQPGSVMTIDFELNGQQFSAINGGSYFTLNEAVSFMIHCESQAEVDYYWEKLTAGSDPKSHQCGWLKDQFGLSWQVVPDEMLELFQDPDVTKRERMTNAMLQMKKLDMAQLRAAFEGK